jgi:PGF-pre-PGF domain-containing protein
MIAEAPESAYAATSLPLRLSTDGTVLEAVAPQEKETNLTHVSRIRVRSASTAQDTEVVVRRSRKDEVPTGPPSVLVLRNLDITLKGIKNSGQASGEIEFEVKRSWLQEQDIDASTVSLYRLHDEWEKLPTEQVGQSVGAEDQLYERYLAKTPGFSVFAIGVTTQPVAVQPPLASPTSGPIIIASPTPTVTPGTIPQEVVLPKPTPTPLLVPTPEPTPTPTPTPTATSLLATPEPTPTPTSRPTAMSPPSLMGGRIVFSSERDGNPEIYVMNPDGSGQTRLTDNVAGDLDPSWSPDGSRIAFASYRSYRDGNPEIYVMNADGSGQIRLTDNVAEYPAWSPDGSRIAFFSNRDGNPEIYVMNADGSGQINLTNNDTGEWNLSWSPDGSRIAFTAERDGNYEIYVMNADGSGQIRLTEDAYDWKPSWSPDGSRITFVSERDGNPEIYVMNADGSGQTRLTDTYAGDSDPSWSPDGSRITFVSDRDGNHEIYVINADGSGQTRLTNSYASNVSPDWGPDWMEIDENSFVNFPDEALEAAVRDSLGKGLKGQITLEDLAALTEMNADSREISNLSGIEHAVNLTLFEISGNPISDFSPLASLTKLEQLNITGVGLSDLSFLITLKNLKQLTLHANEIADISLLSHLTALEYLNLDRNNVVDITPLLSLNSLETLILVDNALLNTESLNKHVPNLISRGVDVTTGCTIYC